MQHAISMCSDLPFSCLQGLTHLKSQLLQLASIVLRIEQWDAGFPHEENRTPPIGLFESAPLLHDVDLGYPCSTLEISLPWQQLTHLRAQSLRVEDVIELLRQTLKLEHCTMELISVIRATTADGVPPRHPTLLPNLVSLSLMAGRQDDFQRILPTITAPALRELYLTNIYIFPFPYAEFLAFLERSSCSLQRLRLGYTDLSDVQLIKCLWLMPSLIIANVSTRNETVEASSYPALEAVTLPNLKTFAIDYHVNGTETVECGRILDSLVLPLAEEVSVQGTSRPGTYAMRTPFLRFLSPMSRSLRRLSLVPLVITASKLHQHLKCVPSLVELRLGSPMGKHRDDASRQDDIIPLLGLAHPDAILPNLEVFEYHDALSFDGEELVKLLAARWRRTGMESDDGRARLGSVFISTGKYQAIELNERAESQLQGLVGEGLRLELSKTGFSCGY